MVLYVSLTHGTQAIDALREVFAVALLPDRKLVSFEDQPLSAVPSGKEGLRCLLYYHFEDQLKKRYRLTLFRSWRVDWAYQRRSTGLWVCHAGIHKSCPVLQAWCSCKVTQRQCLSVQSCMLH